MQKNENLREEFKNLLSLQEIDNAIFDITQEIKEIPLRQDEIARSLENKKAGMAQAEEELKRLQVLKGEHEGDIESRENKIQKYQSDLYSIKNNKEYQALQQEINSMKADISVIEDELLKLFDKIEAARRILDDEKIKFENETKATSVETKEMLEKELELKGKLQQLITRRDEISGKIDPVILAQYQKILDKWCKNAISEVQDEFCGECNMHLRPQIINESRLCKRVVFCENCSRILYAPE